MLIQQAMPDVMQCPVTNLILNLTNGLESVSSVKYQKRVVTRSDRYFIFPFYDLEQEPK